MAPIPSRVLTFAMASALLFPLAALSQKPARDQKVCLACKRRFVPAENFCMFDGKKLLLLPRVPWGVKAEPKSQTETRISWADTGGDEAGFVVERRAANGGAYAVVGRCARTPQEFLDTGLQMGRKYLYRVRSFNAAGASGNSVEALVATLPAPPAVPAQVQARGLRGGQVVITWREASQDAQGYVVERRGSDGTFREVARLGKVVFEYTDTNLPEGASYTYRVAAVNPGGLSAFSAGVAGGPLPNPPGMPANLIATAVGDTCVRLDWTDTANSETEFRLERRAEGGEFQTVATLRGGCTSACDTGLHPATRYAYRVSAANTGGASEWTPGVSVVTLPAGRKPPASEVTGGPVVCWAIPSRIPSRPGENLKMAFHFDLGGRSGKLISRWGRFYAPDGRLLRDWVGPFGQPEKDAMGMPVSSGTNLVFDHAYVIPPNVLDRMQEVGSTTVVMPHFFDGRFSDGTRFVCAATLTIEFGTSLEGRKVAGGVTPARPATRVNPKDDAQMVALGAGGVHLGDDAGAADERPLHPVQLSGNLWAYQKEVTNAQFRRFVEATGHPEPAFWDDSRLNRPEQPVVGVSWTDAAAYAQWAGGRLPTEAEWEWLARGIDERPYPWGSQPPDSTRAVFGGAPMQAAGARAAGANALGLFDLAGNAAEWCADWYDAAYYAGSPWGNPKGPAAGTRRVVRGGSWQDPPDRLRAGARASAVPDLRSPSIGFRLVLPR